MVEARAQTKHRQIILEAEYITRSWQRITEHTKKDINNGYFETSVEMSRSHRASNKQIADQLMMEFGYRVQILDWCGRCELRIIWE